MPGVYRRAWRYLAPGRSRRRVVVTSPVPSFAGAAAVASEAATASGTGTFTPGPISGTAAVTLAALTASGAGVAPVAGAAVSTLAEMTASGSGNMTYPDPIGSGAATVAASTSAGSGLMLQTLIFPVANISRGGRWGTPSAVSGITGSQRLGTNSEFRAKITGTKGEVHLIGNGATISWTVDGGSVQTASPNSSVQWLTMFDGLSDAPHEVVFQPAPLYLDTVDTIRVTGGSPACTVADGYTNTQYTVAAANITTDGSLALFSAEGYDTLQQRGCVRFYGTPGSAGTLRVWCRYGGGHPIALVVDENYLSPQRQTPATTWGWITFTGLDFSQQHMYRLVIPLGSFIYAVALPNGTVDTTPLTSWGADHWMGDSITGATNITNGDSAINFVELYGLMAHRGWQITAGAGWTAYTQGQANKTAPGLASPAPTGVFLCFGVNDQGSGSGVSTTQFHDAMDAIVTQIRTDLPSVPIYIVGIIPVTSTLTNRAAYNTQSQNIVAAHADPLLQFIETTSLGTLPTSDGTHITGGPTGSVVPYATRIYLYTHPYTGTAAVTTAALTSSASGTTGLSTGSGDVTMSDLVTAGSGTLTPPSYAGTAAPSLSATTANGSGTAASYIGAATVSLTSFSATASGTAAVPTYVGTGSPSLPQFAVAGDGDHADYIGSATVSLAVAAASGSGTAAGPVYSGTGAANIAAVTTTSHGLFVSVIVGTAAATLSEFVCASHGAIRVTTYTGRFVQLRPTESLYFLPRGVQLTDPNLVPTGIACVTGGYLSYRTDCGDWVRMRAVTAGTFIRVRPTGIDWRTTSAHIYLAVTSKHQELPGRSCPPG